MPDVFVCVTNSPRSFFSLENESNLLRRDFLRLCVSVRKNEKVNMDNFTRDSRECLNDLVHTFTLSVSLLSVSLFSWSNHTPTQFKHLRCVLNTFKFKRPRLWPFSVLLLIVSPPESFYLFLHAKNRAGLFNRPEPVVCLNSPLLNGCADPGIKDKGA